MQVDLADAGIDRGGLDQRQGDGAVEQVGPARLAGPLRRAGDVEDVVEQLEGEADLGAELAQVLVIVAEQAGTFEQRRGLQSAAVQVALLGDLEVEGIVALGQLAAGQGDRGVGEQLDRAGVAGVGEQGEGAGEQQVAGGDGAGRGPRWRRRSGGRGAAAPRRGRRRGRASPCGPARSRSRRGPRLSPPFSPAQSRTSIGRRRLPPAASVEAASSPSRSPWAAIVSRSRSSTSPRRAGNHRLDASSTAVTGGGTAERRVTVRFP